MAGTTLHNKAWSTDPDMVAEHNKALDDLELLRARVHAICGKLDADGGVTDTNYAAAGYSSTVAIATAAVLLAAKLGTTPT
jgi:hypothetical protein